MERGGIKFSPGLVWMLRIGARKLRNYGIVRGKGLLTKLAALHGSCAGIGKLADGFPESWQISVRIDSMQHIFCLIVDKSSGIRIVDRWVKRMLDDKRSGCDQAPKRGQAKECYYSYSAKPACFLQPERARNRHVMFACRLPIL